MFQCYRVNSVSIFVIFMWICDMKVCLKMRRFTVEYMCMLFVGDGFKYRF
jgi:hypothetical protein